MTVFQRAAGSGPLRPGQWRSHGPTPPSPVFVVCPTCGALGTLDHEIAADGTITPSLQCPGTPERPLHVSRVRMPPRGVVRRKAPS